MNRRVLSGSRLLFVITLALWPLLLIRIATAAEYKIKILSDLRQEYPLLDLRHSTHIWSFVVLDNANKPLRADQLRSYLTNGIWAVAVEDTGRTGPHDASFLAVTRPQDRGQLSVADDTTVVARFAGRLPDRYYHYRVFFRPVSSNAPIASTQTVYMRGGYPGEVANLWKIVLTYFCWIGLALTGVFGLAAAGVMYVRLKSRERLAIYDGKLIPLIRSHWNSIAKKENTIRESGTVKWDAEMLKEYNDMLDILQGYVTKPHCSLARILDAGLRNHYMNRGAELASSEVDRAMLTEAAHEELCLRGRAHDIIRQMAVLSPLFGLLGTVVGISYAFGGLPAAMKNTSEAPAVLLAPDIKFALWTTVIGLIIAVVLSAIHLHLADSIKVIVGRWQKAIVESGREI